MNLNIKKYISELVILGVLLSILGVLIFSYKTEKRTLNGYMYEVFGIDNLSNEDFAVSTYDDNIKITDNKILLLKSGKSRLTLTAGKRRIEYDITINPLVDNAVYGVLYAQDTPATGIGLSVDEDKTITYCNEMGAFTLFPGTTKGKHTIYLIKKTVDSYTRYRIADVLILDGKIAYTNPNTGVTLNYKESEFSISIDIPLEELS